MRLHILASILVMLVSFLVGRFAMLQSKAAQAAVAQAAVIPPHVHNGWYLGSVKHRVNNCPLKYSGADQFPRNGESIKMEMRQDVVGEHPTASCKWQNGEVQCLRMDVVEDTCQMALMTRTVVTPLSDAMIGVEFFRSTVSLGGTDCHSCRMEASAVMMR